MALNYAENVVGTYLRLNGFLHLPHFTVFSDAEHGHVDFVGLRAANSLEAFAGGQFPIDDELFQTCVSPELRDPKMVFLGAVVEVRTNVARESPSTFHTRYVQSFLGGVPVVRLSFCDCVTPLRKDHDGVVVVSMRHTMSWIQERIRWMQEQEWRFSKTGSWTLSEEFLANILVEYERGWTARNPLA